jgi:flagellar assembly protein FliH
MPASAAFVAGFAARHDAAAHMLAAAFAPAEGFAPRAVVRDAPAPEPSDGPRHFSPANPGHNPTEGWDPLDSGAEQHSFFDPLQAAHAAGYAEGLAAAATAQAELETRHAAAIARDRAMLETLAASLTADDRIDRNAIAARLRQTVLFLVTKLVGEVGVSSEMLAARVEAAADLLADASESAMLRVHPDDVALLDGRLPRTIFPVGDTQVARGSFVLESASTLVEDGPALWLEQLGHAIERVAVPPSC